jgi:hypothetical protein
MYFHTNSFGRLNGHNQVCIHKVKTNTTKMVKNVHLLHTKLV